MKLLNKVMFALMGLLLAAPAWATPSAQTNTTFKYVHITKDLKVDGTATFAATGSTVFTGTVNFSGATVNAGGYVLAGTSYNGTLVVPAALGQATTYTFPDPGAATANIVLDASAQSIGGVKTFTSIPVLPAGGAAFKGTSYNIILKALAAVGQATTVTIPDPGASTANVVLDTGTQTLAGTYTFSTPPTITGGLTAANIQTGSAKRELLRISLSPSTGAAANGTTYYGLLLPGRAGTVKRISYACKVAPIAGTDTIKVLKASSSGNTMLATASVDATGLTAYTVVQDGLTATGADLQVTAAQPIYCEYAQGTTSTAAQLVEVTVEFEPTDF